MGTQASGRRTVGHIFKRPSGVWALRYVVKGKDIRVSLDTTDKTEARKKAKQYLHPVQAETEVERRTVAAAALSTSEEALAQAQAQLNRIPLSEVWTLFPYDHTAPGRGATRQLSIRNVEENRLAWSKFARWAMGVLGEEAHLEDVTPETALAYSRHLHDDEHVTAGRHNKLLTIARVMYRRAGRSDPFVSVPRHAVRHESRRNLEVDELRKVCTAATGELRRLFAIMLYTGLRVGDAVTLDWSGIAHGRIIRRMAKTGKDVAFPVHPVLAAVLNEVPEAERAGAACPTLAAEYVRNHTRISQRIRKHLEDCELVCVEEGENRQKQVSRLGAHAFRHSFISECARAGVPEGAIRDWVGHSSVEITRIYAHCASRESDDRILAALPKDALGTAALPDPGAAIREEITKLLPGADLERLQAALMVLKGGA